MDFKKIVNQHLLLSTFVVNKACDKYNKACDKYYLFSNILNIIFYIAVKFTIIEKGKVYWKIVKHSIQHCLQIWN